MILHKYTIQLTLNVYEDQLRTKVMFRCLLFAKLANPVSEAELLHV